MRAFLTKIEDFFAAIGNKISALLGSKKKEGEGEAAPEKKPGIFDRADAFLARFDGSFLIWSFFLSAAIMLLVYVAMDVHPFGESSVLVLDLNGQYVQFFAGLRNILHGDGSLLYSFSRSLGGEYLGIYTYYLASPLSWLVALFPEKNILEALLVIFVLKSGLAGLNFGAFLHYSRRPPKTLTVGLSVLYALSSYGVVMQHNTMWIDGMMLIPLVILGLERLIKEKKPILYTASLAMVLLCNYYIGYMLCIFTAIYFFYYFLAHDKDELNARGEKNHFGASLLRVGVYSALALGLSAILLLPAYYSLTFGKTDFTTGNFALTAKFDIIDFLAKMFPGAYDTVRPEGLPWVYSGVLALILLPLYFAAAKIPVREKIATGGLALLLFLSMYINTLDVLWHGGQAPNWLNYRYSFLFTFVVLLMAARALTALQSIHMKAILISGGAFILLAAILQKLSLTCTTDGKTTEYFNDLNGVWLTIGCTVIYTFLLLLLNGHETSSPRFEPIAMLIVAVIAVETLLNGVFYLRRQNEDVVISNYASYHDFYDVYDAPFDYIAEHDDTPFYRADKTFQHTVCDSFVLDYKGLASSTSTLNAAVVRFQHNLGMKSNSHWTEATGSTIVTNSLLGVKYWVAKANETVDPLYVEYHRDGSGDAATVTYQNPYALPLAFASATGGLRDISFIMPTTAEESWDVHKLSPITRTNAIFAGLTGIKDLTVYDPLEAVVTPKGGMIEKEGVLAHTTYECTQGNAEARIVFTFIAPEDGSPVYCYFPTSWAREAKLYVNNAWYNYTVFYPGYANIASNVCLGSFAPGESVSVELSCESSGAFYLTNNTPYFFTIDKEDLQKAYDMLSIGGLRLETAEDDRFEGTVTAAKGMTTVQTTIPYDAGWRIRINGERVEGYMTADALLAFDLPAAGTYEISLVYRPAIYTAGLIISLLSLLIFGGVIAMIILRNKKKLTLSPKNPLTRTISFFLPEPEIKVDPAELEAIEKANEEAIAQGKRVSGQKPTHKASGKRKK